LYQPMDGPFALFSSALASKASGDGPRKGNGL
jgi:hypothetical protein